MISHQVMTADNSQAQQRIIFPRHHTYICSRPIQAQGVKTMLNQGLGLKYMSLFIVVVVTIFACWSYFVALKQLAVTVFVNILCVCIGN